MLFINQLENTCFLGDEVRKNKITKDFKAFAVISTKISRLIKV